MPGKTRRSESNKKYFTVYKAENRAELNAIVKMDRHLKSHPNDLQSKSKKIPNYKPKKLDNIQNK